MRHTTFIISFILCSAIAFICPVLSFAKEVDGDEVVWHLQSHRSEESPLHQNALKYIINPVNEELKGQFKIVLHPQQPRESLQNNKAVFSATKYGKTDGFLTTTMYWGDIDPVFAVIGDLVGAWPTPNDFLDWYAKDGYYFLQAAYARNGLHLVDVSVTPEESLVSKKPVRSLDDIKGKVVRTPPGGMASAYFTEIGAISREIDTPNVYKAFLNEKIDIADYGTVSINNSEHLYEHAKYSNYPGFHSMPVLDFVINANLWDSTPQNVKDVINKHAKIWQTQALADLIEEDVQTLKLLNDNGVHVDKWTDNELLKARKIAIKVWDDYAKKSVESADVIRSIKKWLSSKNLL